MSRDNRRDDPNVRRDWRIPDEMWERIEPLLPPRKAHPLGCHRRRVDDRRAMDAIFFVLRTGCQWNALNATGICSSSSAHRRFQEWAQAGVFRKLWQIGLGEYDLLKGIDWSWLSMDAAMTKAPLGGEKDGTQPDGSGQEGHETQPAHRRRRRPDRLGGRRGQPGGLQDGAGDDPEHPRRATYADAGEAAGHEHGQGLRL